MVCGSHATTRAIYSTPPCPSLAASTAAYRRRSFSDSHPKNRCIFCSTSAAYPSMPHSLIQNLLRGKELERLCYMLATEMLMPYDVFLQLVGTDISVQKLFGLASVFKTSLSST